MINVIIGQNLLKKTINNVDESTVTPRQLLEENGMDCDRFAFHMNGDAVTADMLDKTFLENGIVDPQVPCYLVSVTKTDSAA